MCHLHRLLPTLSYPFTPTSLQPHPSGHEAVGQGGSVYLLNLLEMLGAGLWPGHSIMDCVKAQAPCSSQESLSSKNVRCLHFLT